MDEVFGQTPLQAVIESVVTNGLGFKNCFEGREFKKFKELDLTHRLRRYDSDLELQEALAYMESEVAFNPAKESSTESLTKRILDFENVFQLTHLLKYCIQNGIDLHEYNTPEKIEALWQEKKGDVHDMINAKAKEGMAMQHIIGYPSDLLNWRPTSPYVLRRFYCPGYLKAHPELLKGPESESGK